MDRRGFLSSAGGGVLSRWRVFQPRATLFEDVDASGLEAEIANGGYRLIGALPATDEVVLQMESGGADSDRLVLRTYEAYTSPEPERGPPLTVQAREATIFHVGRTPYRVTLLPSFGRTPPEVTSFIRFADAIALAVYVKTHRFMDLVALVEAHQDATRLAHPR